MAIFGFYTVGEVVVRSMDSSFLFVQINPQHILLRHPFLFRVVENFHGPRVGLSSAELNINLVVIASGFLILITIESLESEISDPIQVWTLF